MDSYKKYLLIFVITIINTLLIVVLIVLHFSNNPSISSKSATAVAEMEPTSRSKEQVSAISKVQPVSDTIDKSAKSQATSTGSQGLVRSRDELFVSKLTLADSLYRDGDYVNARIYYQEAARININYTYPMDKIKLIDMILATKNSEETPANKPPVATTETDGLVNQMTSHPAGEYHIVVGVFSSVTNANTMIKELENRGKNPKSIDWKEPGSIAVIYDSYTNREDAYMNLPLVQNEIAVDAWVMRKRF